MRADLFDLPARAEPARPSKTFDATTPCPWKGCGKPVGGVDPMRTCSTCRAASASLYVPWAQAKNTSATVLPELVLVLANAHLSETAVKSAKDEVGSFEPRFQAVAEVSSSPPDFKQLGTFPCGHPRRSVHGFCGACNPARL